jgi:hypothetical protein
MNKRGRLFSSFERWPDGLFYAPVVLYWIYLTLAFRGFLVLLTNPKMALGGFTADLKSDWFKLLGKEGRAHAAPYALMTSAQGGGDAGLAEDLEEARRTLAASGLSYPIVAKPDLGKNGTGVRVIEREATLAEYLSSFPRAAGLVLQRYIPYENEAGVFYIRYPGEERGCIASLTLKYFPKVKGDGTCTLEELILADPRASKIKHLYFKRHQARLKEVVPTGEEVRLVSVGNHCKGAIFKNGAAHITPALEAAFDRIAKEMPEFWFGRFDVRFGSLERFAAGEDFYILEVNGPGSEMTHIWDADETLAGAYRALFGQYRAAWEIGARNRARGFALPSLSEVIRAYRAELALLKDYTWEE